MDYIFLIQADVETLPVPNEVKAVKYVSKDGLAKFLDECGKCIYIYICVCVCFYLCGLKQALTRQTVRVCRQRRGSASS